ncbi:MAG: N-acetyl-gamma-glutamyl-phosphate reductase, partial [Candidatus Peregrinibacteria bacterium]
MSKKKIGIVGVSGFTGLELIRVLAARDDIELSLLSSRSLAGTRVKDVFPEITLRDDLVFVGEKEEDCSQLDLVFLAMENGKAMELVPKIPCKIIDLSADFRFLDRKKWEQIYRMSHICPEKKAIYGLPELFSEEIKTANLVANPGCFATASLLATLPFQKNPHIERIVLDGKTGISGAGRRNGDTNNYNFLSENVIPYKITNHRHEAEIQQFFLSPSLLF